MSDSSFFDLLKQDKRYKAEAYAFVLETLEHAQNVLKLGHTKVNEPLPPNLRDAAEDKPLEMELHEHVSGQDLCLAALDYSQRQYGLLAPMVLGAMGIRTTDDIGEIVFNLIAIGQMRKTSDDRREDFSNVFDFQKAFDGTYHIAANFEPKPKHG